MINAYDIAYGLLGGIAAPYWLTKTKLRQKVLRALRERTGEAPSVSGQSILIHAVALGEINATPALVKLLQQARPDLHIVVSVTTETGYDRGKQLYGSWPGVTLVRFPLDFTKAITRLLDAIHPSLVVLVELELWPNFLRQCHKRSIPVVLVNGRMTPPAFKRYGLIKPVTAAMLRRLAAVCVQDDTYADRFRNLGAPANRVQVTGTMKFDTAQVADRVDGDGQLAVELGLDSAACGLASVSSERTDAKPQAAVPVQNPLWVCGSTGPGEETIVLDAFAKLQQQFSTLRLAIIPRHPQRFDEVAALIAQRGFPLLRRSTRAPAEPNPRPIILGDTMGELRKFYSLAAVVFVGRSLVDLGSRQHGSDMIEPAALAKPVALGPWTHNFAEAVQKLREANAIVEVTDATTLSSTIARWLSNPDEAAEFGRRAQQVVRENQGATKRHADVILRHLPSVIASST
jgi:3-deoxy-D-manno-octulosonic-acid transferase